MYPVRHATRMLLTVAGVIGISAAGVAAPGEQRVIQGRMVWPSVVTPAQGSPEGFIIVHGDDGRTYYADVAVALRVRPVTLQAGDRVEVVGMESGRPHVFTAVAVRSGPLPTSIPSALPRDAVVPPSSAPLPPPVASGAPAVESATGESRDRGPAPQTVSGRVQSFSQGRLRLKTSDGRVLAIDMSAIDTAATLDAGDEVTVIGRREPERGFVARGFVQESSAPGSALPRQAR